MSDVLSRPVYWTGDEGDGTRFELAQLPSIARVGAAVIAVAKRTPVLRRELGLAIPAHILYGKPGEVGPLERRADLLYWSGCKIALATRVQDVDAVQRFERCRGQVDAARRFIAADRAGGTRPVSG